MLLGKCRLLSDYAKTPCLLSSVDEAWWKLYWWIGMELKRGWKSVTCTSVEKRCISHVIPIEDTPVLLQRAGFV
ncbi:hypothetical protein JTE90_005724 [Oedothorax gibbosus]|uniref:Uncharacterized protein n=1 Tax=Oedothorax gibbosus TaxID=931172 RepID=A0AAV6UN54_9ARAC|nr:hypothetical protein JTE90_005724 [Oedothorax gibbosus]